MHVIATLYFTQFKLYKTINEINYNSSYDNKLLLYIIKKAIYLCVMLIIISYVQLSVQ